MYYLDTSVIAAYYCPEPLSDKAEPFLIADNRPAISSLTELELFSAISRKVREGNLNKQSAGRILAAFLSHLDNQLYIVIPVDGRHYRLARDWIGLLNNSLRSLDALHLAVTSIEDRSIVTSDHGLARSARALGVNAVLLK
jgi:hypothetical protein